MKILYIANARIPTEKAHGIQIMKMCEAFAMRHDVELALILPRRINEIKEDPFKYYDVDRIFKIKKVFCLDLIVLDKYLGKLGLWVENITFFFFVLPHVLFSKTDIIYTREKLLLPLSAIKKNLVFEGHTFPGNYFIYSPFFKKLKGLVVITQELKELFAGRGMSSNKILVAPDGVDLKKFHIQETKEECRRKLNLSQDQKIILYVGHLYKWKGTGVLLEVARKFSIDNYQFSNYFFIFVGGTAEDIADFKKRAESIENVLIAGHKPHKEIPYWLGAADVLCLPNSGKEDISKYWTSPMKMFEYMAAKRPIVASKLPSIQEILNEENAVLVEPDNPAALAQGIKGVLQNSQLSDKISKKALEDVQEYSWENRVSKILNFIMTHGHN